MPSNAGRDSKYPGVTHRQRSRIVDRIDLEYGGSSWDNSPDYVARYDKRMRAAEARNRKVSSVPSSLEEKAANRSLGETPKSKIAQAEMARAPHQTLAEELSGGDPKLAEQFEEGFQKTSERLKQQRGVERRTIQGGPPEGTPERRKFERRQGIQEIKRLKGELAAESVRKLNPSGRDTLVRDVPRIEGRIEGLQRKLVESAPGPARGRLSGLSRAGKLGGKALGVAGTVASIPEHWRAANAVETEENKDAPWIDKFAAYSERVLGMPTGSSGRRSLPSEARAANQL